MKELLTVKQVKEFLDNFDDNCKVMINVDGIPMPIQEYGWSGNDNDREDYTSVEYSMKRATSLSLYPVPSHESE